MGRFWVRDRVVTVDTGPFIGLSTMLTGVFLTLKLTGVIAWPWVWVLAPTWISMAGAVLFFAVAALVLWRWWNQ